MPELPEVEILTRELSTKITSHIINKIIQNPIKLRKPIPLLDVLINEKILKITRMHKYIVIATNKYYLIIHLGMTGKLLINDYFIQKKHTHVILYLNNSLFMSYEDTRKFGLIELLDKKNYPTEKALKKYYSLGQEPLSPDFTKQSLINFINKYPNQNIKKFIMDYKIICGIGNIYACEILFLSKISPYRIVKSLNDSEIKLIHTSIKKILTKAILMGGSSISDYVHSNGETGNMQNFYMVYNRENNFCKKCKQQIKRIKQNGRSTYFCPFCQI